MSNSTDPCLLQVPLAGIHGCCISSALLCNVSEILPLVCMNWKTANDLQQSFDLNSITTSMLFSHDRPGPELFILPASKRVRVPNCIPNLAAQLLPLLLINTLCDGRTDRRTTCINCQLGVDILATASGDDHASQPPQSVP